MCIKNDKEIDREKECVLEEEKYTKYIPPEQQCFIASENYVYLGA